MTDRIRVGVNTDKPGGGEWIILYRRADESKDYIEFATPHAWEGTSRQNLTVVVPKAFFTERFLRGDPLPDADLKAKAQKLCASGKKIEAIQLVREQRGSGLREALDMVDGWIA